jgi:membrane protein involved in colicin uptake
MKRQLLKISSVLFVVILFSLMSGVALAQKKHWFVVKDNNGMCKVIEAETIAGPFKTMEQAEKRKAKDCPRGAGQATEQLRHQQEQPEHMRPPQEQAEKMRRQHQQREEPQQQHLKQQQTPQQQQKLAPQQQQQTEKMKGKAQDKTEGSKPSEEKVKEKTTEPIPSEKKN